MTKVLYLLVWITALKMSWSYNPTLPPIWAWTRQFDNQNWAIRTSSYKYPVVSQQLRFAPLQDFESHYIVKVVPDCINHNARSEESHESRMNQRSIPNSNIQRLQESGITYQHNVQEPVLRRSDNGSSKILNHFLKPNKRRGQIDNSPITFPGPATRARYEPEIPESCRNSTFCEDIPNYPQEEVDRLISKLGKTVRFQVDKLDLPDTPDINQRVGPIDENVELCQFEEKVVYPKGAQGADGKWYTLVNRRDNPVQGYRIEVCNLSAGNGCSGIAVFQQGYEARCKQKYVYRTVTAFEKNNDGLRTFEQQVKLPSCCSCVAKNILP